MHESRWVTHDAWLTMRDSRGLTHDARKSLTTHDPYQCFRVHQQEYCFRKAIRLSCQYCTTSTDAVSRPPQLTTNSRAWSIKITLIASAFAVNTRRFTQLSPKYFHPFRIRLAIQKWKQTSNAPATLCPTLQCHFEMRTSTWFLSNITNVVFWPPHYSRHHIGADNNDCS